MQRPHLDERSPNLHVVDGATRPQPRRLLKVGQRGVQPAVHERRAKQKAHDASCDRADLGHLVVPAAQQVPRTMKQGGREMPSAHEARSKLRLTSLRAGTSLSLGG
eukprot:194742-Chlamydomonas_euryale.AAC.2